jgi:hypothetical protein
VTASSARHASRVRSLNADLFDLCCAVAECEGMFRRVGWHVEADLFFDLFEALEDRLALPYPSEEVDSFALSCS